MDEPIRIKPFGSISQHNNWERKNCLICENGFTVNGFKCDIQKSIYVPTRYRLSVTMDIATRMGFISNQEKKYWVCPELIPKEEHRTWRS